MPILSARESVIWDSSVRVPWPANARTPATWPRRSDRSSDVWSTWAQAGTARPGARRAVAPRSRGVLLDVQSPLRRSSCHGQRLGLEDRFAVVAAVGQSVARRCSAHPSIWSSPGRSRPAVTAECAVACLHRGGRWCDRAPRCRIDRCSVARRGHGSARLQRSWAFAVEPARWALLEKMWRTVGPASEEHPRMTEPLFADSQLILPEGTLLKGSVLQSAACAQIASERAVANRFP